MTPDTLEWKACVRCKHVRRVRVKRAFFGDEGPLWSTLCGACVADEDARMAVIRAQELLAKAERFRQEQEARVQKRPADWTPPGPVEILYHARGPENEYGGRPPLCGAKSTRNLVYDAETNCPKCRRKLEKQKRGAVR